MNDSKFEKKIMIFRRPRGLARTEKGDNTPTAATNWSSHNNPNRKQWSTARSQRTGFWRGLAGMDRQATHTSTQLLLHCSTLHLHVHHPAGAATPPPRCRCVAVVERLPRPTGRRPQLVAPALRHSVCHRASPRHDGHARANCVVLPAPTVDPTGSSRCVPSSSAVCCCLFPRLLGCDDAFQATEQLLT